MHKGQRAWSFAARLGRVPQRNQQTRKWIFPSLLLVFSFMAVCILVMTQFPAGPGEVLSTDKKTSEWKPEISPMGAIARGDVPIPRIESIHRPPSWMHATSQVPMGLQGTDKLVHSPTAVDFQSETTIVQVEDIVVVGFNDVRGFSLPNVSVSGYAYSSDGGNTWTDGNQLPTAGGVSAVYGDPDVKTWTDGGGQTYFFYSSLYVTPNDSSSLCLHVSTDDGATWTSPREVTTATSWTDFPDKVFQGVDPETGRIFLSWTNFGVTNTMRISYSDDFGVTWNGPWIFASSVGQGSIPRADGSSDNVYLAWRTNSTIQFCKSTDNGVTWHGPTTIASGLTNPMNPYGSDRIHGFPSMEVDHTTGNIYLVFSSRDLWPDFGEVYFMRSTNGGVSWSARQAINANPGSDGCQYFPWITVDQSDGRIDAIWYDQINATGTSDITDLFHTHSMDEGVTFACPTPLNDNRFHAEYGNTTSQPNVGDYNQCVSSNGTLYTAFAKTTEPSYLTYEPDTYVDVSDASGSVAPIRYAGSAFIDVGCTTANGYIEPWENVWLLVTIEHYSPCAGTITLITGTLTTSTPGVTILSGTQSFGNLSGVGATSQNTMTFTFTVDPSFPCGDDIDLLLAIGSSEGEARIPIRLPTGVPTATVLLSEDFDTVMAPAFPSGWQTENVTGTDNPWVTSTTYSSSGSNSAFCADISTTSGNRLRTPVINVPVDCDLLDVTFEITHNIELDVERKAWDGALLQLWIDDGVGTYTKLAGSFASLFEPFYPWQMNRQSSSIQPLQDLACWSSDVTPDFSTVHMQFPGLAGSTVELWWEMGTDASTGTPTGMFVDDVVVTSITKTCVCTKPADLVAVPGTVEFQVVPANEATCDTVYLVNMGPSVITISEISGCTDPPFSIDTTMTDHVIAAGDSTTMVVCVTPTEQGPDACQITVVSDEAYGPLDVPVTFDVVTAIEGGEVPMPFRIVSVSPNPFNPSTTIRFTLPARMAVTAEIWSVTGARVKVLADDKTFAPGENALRWDGRTEHGAPAASGVYFVRVKTLAGEKVTRAVLLK